MFCFILSTVAWAVSSFVVGTAANPLHLRAQPDSKGAVASETAICSRIGIDLIEAGGNAADALVGTVFCVGVIGMYHSGIGGGGFMIVRAPNGTYQVIDFRETAPAASTQDMYNNDTALSLYGGLAREDDPISCRCASNMRIAACQPAINVSRNGWTVNEDLVNYIAATNVSSSTNYIDFWCKDPNWAIDFCPNGTIVQLNQTITRKRYADTLEEIATYGADAFYTGAIARTTITAVNATGGIMTLEDLANYTAVIRTPVNITYRDYQLFAAGAPSGGQVCLSILNILSGYDDYFSNATLNISTHRLNEAMRFAYGQRTEMGDPDFVANMSLFQQEILTPAIGADVRSRISDFTTQNVSAYDPSGFQSLITPGTSAVMTADASGLAISLTTTINGYFGSQVLVPETGIIMNNEMNDFSIPGSSNAFGYIPTPDNYIEPGKKPLSSISPVIVETAEGQLYYVIGAAGGSRIITATAQNIINVLDRNMSAPEALAQPRLHDQLIPNLVSFETTYDNNTVAYLASKGDNVSWVAPGQSTAQGIIRLPNGTFQAAGEPRQLDSGGFAI